MIKKFLSLLLASALAITAASAAYRQPHGIYEIGGDALTNPNVNGLRAELKWAAGNPASGVYDWSKLDAQLAKIKQAGKQMSVTLIMLSQVPQWVYDAGAMPYIYQGAPMVLPWDSVARPAMEAFLAAFCQHFDARLDYVVMGGLGYKTETYMPLPADIGLGMTIADYTSAWVSSCESLTEIYAANLASTPFVMAEGVPFSDPGAQAALAAVKDNGLLYRGFGLMQWGLKATSNSDFLLNEWIYDNDAGRATGFQVTGSQSSPHVGGDLRGTLDQALSAGNALGADWVEIYAVDAMNVSLSPVLEYWNTVLH